MENQEITENIVLIGAGGHALSIIEAMGANRFAGYTSLSPAEDIPGEWFGDDSGAARLAAEGYPFHMAFVYAGWPVMKKRRALIELYEKAGARFVSLIAPTAIVTPNSTVGEGSAILNGAIVNRASLGRNVIVNSGAIVEHDCVVGDNTFIGPGAVIGGGVSIGRDCFIGLGARIMNGISIADGVTVAMGAIVNRNLKEPGIYHGSPLRCTKLR